MQIKKKREINKEIKRKKKQTQWAFIGLTDVWATSDSDVQFWSDIGR